MLADDKRGAGESGGDWAAADVDLLAADAAAFALLRAHPALAGGGVGLPGHSEVGWVALRVATRFTDAQFLIVNSCPAVSFQRAEVYAQTEAGVDRHVAAESLMRLAQAAALGGDHSQAQQVLEDAADDATHAATRYFETLTDWCLRPIDKRCSSSTARGIGRDMSQTAGLSRLRSEAVGLRSDFDGDAREEVVVVRVFVAGGTGVLGQRLVPQLLARGHQVTATTTSAAKLELLERLGATGVVMDGLDPVSVGEAVAAADPDTIVHQMTGISVEHAGKPDLKHFDQWATPTIRLRTEGTDHLLAAADATGVSHVVAQGYANWNGIREGGWVKTEQDPLDPCEGTAAQRSMAALNHLESAVVKAGGAVLRYGAFYGPGAIDDQVELVRKRQFPLVGRATGYSSWVHLDDAASATVLAVEQRATGLFNIVDDEPAPASKWLPYLAACAGAKKPMRFPRWFARLAAGEVAVIMMTEGRGFDNTKAKAELAWQLHYSSWRSGFVQALT